jgi:hypothetical protein
MADEKDVEAWADALLDQHRSAPPRKRDHGSPAASLDDLPAGMRMMIRLGDGEPDADQIERLRRSSERLGRLQRIDAMINVIAVVAACVGAFVLLSQF